MKWLLLLQISIILMLISLIELVQKNLIRIAKRPPKTGFILDKAINKLGYNPHSFEECLIIIDEQLNN